MKDRRPTFNTHAETPECKLTLKEWSHQEVRANLFILLDEASKSSLNITTLTIATTTTKTTESYNVRERKISTTAVITGAIPRIPTTKSNTTQTAAITNKAQTTIGTITTEAIPPTTSPGSAIPQGTTPNNSNTQADTKTIIAMEQILTGNQIIGIISFEFYSCGVEAEIYVWSS